MTVYRIVWILASGDEVPDVETYPTATQATLQAFKIQAWAGIPADFEIWAARQGSQFVTPVRHHC